MTADMGDKPAVRREQVVRSLLLLALALLAVFPLFAYFGYRYAEMDGVWAAVIAALLNGAAAFLALLVIVLVRPGPAAAGAVLAGTLFRLALPLGIGLAIVSLNERLADAGLMYQILGFYFVALLVETLLAVRLVPLYQPTSVRQ